MNETERLLREHLQSHEMLFWRLRDLLEDDAQTYELARDIESFWRDIPPSAPSEAERLAALKAEITARGWLHGATTLWRIVDEDQPLTMIWHARVTPPDTHADIQESDTELAALQAAYDAARAAQGGS